VADALTMVEPARLRLAHLPTPLERAERFAAAMGCPPLWIKRDDCTGLALGGNKARKLEFLTAAARAAGADTLVTIGAVQSNHTRMVAAAARSLGMECHLLISGAPPEEVTGNLLLDRILGASLTFLALAPSDLTPQRVEAEFSQAEERLRSAGRRPFRIAPGASTPLGVHGYRLAYDEVTSQAAGLGFRPDRFVVAVGTGGTIAGLVLGNILAGRPARITGISIAPPGIPEALGVPPVRQLVEEGGSMLGKSVRVTDADVSISYDHGGRAYAVPTAEGNEAITALARTESIILDPVYTGKAMAGLVQMSRSGQIARSEKVVFIHTGGTPGLFAYGRALAT